MHHPRELIPLYDWHVLYIQHPYGNFEMNDLMVVYGKVFEWLLFAILKMGICDSNKENEVLVHAANLRKPLHVRLSRSAFGICKQGFLPHITGSYQ